MVYQTAERLQTPAHFKMKRRLHFEEEEQRNDPQFSTEPKAGGGNEGNEADSDDGPLVKRLRRGPLTPQTWVRFPHGSPFFSANPLQAKTGVLLCFGNGGKERGQSPLSCFFPFGKQVGVYDGEGPPVPIPNTEVKLVGGENTCLATDREDSTMPTLMVLNSSVGRARGC